MDKDRGSLGDEMIAAVLAGGEGRRMGGVKALRAFRGAPLVVHAVQLARGWSDRVVVVVRDPAQVAGATEAALAFDRPDVPGPLAGLAGALAHAAETGAALVLTLPCDMPNLPADLPARLAAGLAPKDGAALPQVDGQLQPVCGLWRTTALAQLPAYLATGQSSLRGFAAACGCSPVDFGPDGARLFANANTPDELARLEREAR
jgi:molybdopterin-guanine dinucleotide biosynthesis protein A